jgi:hypothetical protein
VCETFVHFATGLEFALFCSVNAHAAERDPISSPYTTNSLDRIGAGEEHPHCCADEDPNLT